MGNGEFVEWNCSLPNLEEAEGRRERLEKGVLSLG